MGGTSSGPTEAASLVRMSLQNVDGLDQVGGSGSNEILNLFSMNKNTWTYETLDVGYKRKRDVKNGFNRFGLNN